MNIGIYICIGVQLLLIVVFLVLSYCVRSEGGGHGRSLVLKLWNKRWLFHYSTPFWLTMFLAFVFNMSLLQVSVVSSEESSVVGLSFAPYGIGLVAFSLFFAALTFFVATILQKLFVQILFTTAMARTMEILDRQHDFLQAFVIELYAQFSYAPNFIAHIANTQDTYSNIGSLVSNLQSDQGVFLDNYLYSILLRSSLNQKPSVLLSVWDTTLVNLNEQSLYNRYFDVLEKVYLKIDNDDNKCRVFVVDDDSVAEFAREFQRVGLQEKHRNWYNAVYYCSKSQYEEVKSALDNVVYNDDDFIFFQIKNQQWIIGKRRIGGNEKTVITHVPEPNLVTTFFAQLRSVCVSDRQVISLTNETM